MKTFRMFSYCLLFAVSSPLVAFDKNLFETVINSPPETFLERFSYEEFLEFAESINDEILINLSDKDFGKFRNFLLGLIRITSPNNDDGSSEKEIRQLLDQVADARVLSRALGIISLLPDDLQTEIRSTYLENTTIEKHGNYNVINSNLGTSSLFFLDYSSSQEEVLQSMLDCPLETFLERFSYEEFLEFLAEIESEEIISELSDQDFDKFTNLVFLLARVNTPPGEASAALENEIQDFINEIAKMRTVFKLLQLIESLPYDLERTAPLLFELGNPIIENKTNFDLSEEQHSLLVNFYQELRTVMDETKGSDSIEATKKEKIVELGRAVLLSFEDAYDF